MEGADMDAYPHLFSPITIGTLEIKNRGIMAPMVVGLCGRDGEVTEDFIAYHVARARGGVGLNITGGAFVDQGSKVSPRQLGCHTDQTIPGLRQLADAVHDAGGRIARASTRKHEFAGPGEGDPALCACRRRYRADDRP